jgi:stearoyl-CoA desaturase (Delta-9 desaturase)
MISTLILGFCFYFIAALIGVSIGYHRYFTHRTFSASPSSEIVMLIFGQLCGGRDALTWAGVHRMHHDHSDTPEDPHSPKYLGAWRTLTSSWTVRSIPRRYLIDLLRNPRVMWFYRYGKYLHLALAGITLALSWQLFFIVIAMPYVCARVIFGVLNYLTHRNGESEDLPLLSLLAPGEGWHRVHHEHPGRYRLHQLDIAGWIIERIFITTKPGH